jgi:hypothetical protein
MCAATHQDAPRITPPTAAHKIFTFAPLGNVDCSRVRVVRGAADFPHDEFQGERQERDVRKVVHGAWLAETRIPEKVEQVFPEEEDILTCLGFWPTQRRKRFSRGSLGRIDERASGDDIHVFINGQISPI